MNHTIKHQVTHRSIRKFKDEPLTDAQLDAILDAASHTPTYTFLQAASIIGITTRSNKRPLLPFVSNLMWQMRLSLHRCCRPPSRRAIPEAQGVTPAGMDRAERSSQPSMMPPS